MTKMKKRDDGRYLKTVKDARTGKRLYFYGSSEREVQQKILQYTQKVETGRPFEEVAEEWYNENMPTLAIQSQKSYKPCYQSALEEFSGESIKQIKPKDINSYLRKLGKMGYSEKSVTQRRLVLNLIFKHAVISGDLEINPCASAMTPKGLPKNQRHAASEEDEQKVKDNADVWMLPFIALMTGMRRGEILALQWRDIDFKGNTIDVTKSVCYDNDKPIVKCPKTAKGIRLVPLLNPLKEKLLAIPDKNPDDFIISDDGKKPLTNRRYQTLSRNFRRVTGTKCTAHNLRHSFATVAIENNINPKVVQEILGHKQLSTTMDIYTDLRKKSITSAAEALNKII